MNKNGGQANAKSLKNGGFLAPHRAIDESPSGAPEATQHVGLRDPLRAPGQIREAARKPHVGVVATQRPDEMYGATEIPSGGEPHVGGDLERKSSDKNSQRPADPRDQNEKQAEKERRGLDREFGSK